jgi:hypothetical protein
MNDTIAPIERSDCDWPITNCYIDAWMPILADWRLEPMAGLGVTVAQDYEGDQFTFFKYLHEDLELLYGVIAGELTIYRSLEQQVAGQIEHGRLVLVEVDGHWLPDTRATSYRSQHTKTTIGIDRINLSREELGYYHNGGHHQLGDADYREIFRGPAVLPPYVEFVKRRFPPLTGTALDEAAGRLLQRHLERRPEHNPIRRYRQDFARHMDTLLTEPQSFHDYAFGTFRQLGANFELLAQHLDWLGRRGQQGLDVARHAAAAISADTKALQFKVARIAARGRFDPCDALFDRLEQNYATAMAGLANELH